MNEKLLQTIVKLFAILAKERVTEEERINIREFLSLHLNRETTKEYLKLFDSYIAKGIGTPNDSLKNVDTYDETKEFVDEWGQISEICEKINQSLTHRQRIVLIEKIIELFLRDAEFSNRQSNLIFYFGKLIKVNQNVIKEISNFVLAKRAEDFHSENLVWAGSKKKKGFKSVGGLELDGCLMFLRIPEDEMYFVKYLGEDELSFNGVTLFPKTIHILPTGSVIKKEGFFSLYYSNIISQFVKGVSNERLTFIAENIEFKFAAGDYGIKGVSIAEEDGNLVGIMGSSGSGKTTLLNILNGTQPPDSGRVLLNGIDLYHNNIKPIGAIGYIPQDDFLIEELSVYDNLKYAAELCFKNKNKEEIHELVKQTLKNLGLMEIRHLPVGSPLDKTISGGQRKRLNVGLELLREPTVLFVDEPTSGLSSQDSENIMDLFKELSLRGKMVFVVIHQPSSDIFKMFDSMLILDVGGFPIYYGNPVDAVVHFKETVNMVYSVQGVCPECGNLNPEQIFNIIETKIVNEYGGFTGDRKVSPKQWNEIYQHKFAKPKIVPSNDKLNVAHEIPDWFSQVKIFFRRDLSSKLKNMQYVLINLFEAPLLGIFLAILMKYNQGDGEYTYYSNSNIPVFIFISVVVALFMGLTVSTKEIIKDQKILKREKFLHLSWSSYLSSKISILFFISALQTGLFVVVSCLILEIRGMMLPFWLVLFSVSCASNMMGLNVSSAFRSTITVYILIPILLIPQLILSGVVVNFDRFNPRYANQERVPIIGDLITSRWAFESLMVHFFVENKFEKIVYPYEKQESQTRYFNLFYQEKLLSLLGELTRSFEEGALNDEEHKAKLIVVKNELASFLDQFGYKHLPEFDFLNEEEFDVGVLSSGLEFLNVVQAVYNLRRDEAKDLKDSVITDLLHAGTYDYLKNRYHNEEISAMVRDSYSSLKIVMGKEELIRKYDLIYSDPRPRYLFDYRTSFYTPTKHFAGMSIPTLYFNVLVIWAMVCTLYMSIYFNVPRWIVRFAEQWARRTS